MIVYPPSIDFQGQTTTNIPSLYSQLGSLLGLLTLHHIILHDLSHLSFVCNIYLLKLYPMRKESYAF